MGRAFAAPATYDAVCGRARGGGEVCELVWVVVVVVKGDCVEVERACHAEAEEGAVVVWV